MKEQTSRAAPEPVAPKVIPEDSKSALGVKRNCEYTTVCFWHGILQSF